VHPLGTRLAGGGAGASLPGSDSAAINLQLRFPELSHIIAAVLEFSDGLRCRSIGVFENNSAPRMQAPRRSMRRSVRKGIFDVKLHRHARRRILLRAKPGISGFPVRLTP
jgi:hypothetical protein